MQHLFQPPRLVPVVKEEYRLKNIEVAVLRLDEVHPVISGNKWFKLRAYLEDAAQQQKKTMLTFGGAYSNHILATAAACALRGFQAIGIIRGEKPSILSPTLSDAERYGMHLIFVSRNEYRNKAVPKAVYELFEKEEIYTINEGGYGVLGMQGSMDILKSCNTRAYTHIVAAVGTGTMLAGLIAAAQPQQQITGISVLKNNATPEPQIRNLTGSSSNHFQILHQFHFGGYAKHTPELLQFMNGWFAQTGIPTDFVYTAKTFYAADQLIRNDFFKKGSSVLLIQSGGLQGNRSLPPGTLRF
jgi:1-aminocyclopropane-1-carboxylate deaminase